VENLRLRAARLGPKLGPILFQLPPHWRVQADRLNRLLEILPPDLRYAFEFRDLSWVNPEIMSILKKFNAAFCLCELAGYNSPLHITADFTWVRLHGPAAGKYQGTYCREKLQTWAHQIENWEQAVKATYVYFDNDQSGYAAEDALPLKKLVWGQPAIS
jgi:uncharacterized protein YecE (DUF72 family)